MRMSLSENQTIELMLATDAGHTRRFVMQKILGNGSSCIAYKATEVTSRLSVIIKECFPLNSATRAKNGTLIWNTSRAESIAKERFNMAFNTQREIQSFDETSNTSVHLIDGLYVGNNTLYSVSDIQCAMTYDALTDASLQEIFITARAVARTIGQYHTRGYLHLDVKPQNVLIIPETRDIVKLIDFDSIVKKSNVTHSEVSISYTHEYAAPELLQDSRNKLCEATDIYSIGAVVFSRIMGYTPSASDRSALSEWDLNNNSFFKCQSQKTHRLTKQLFRKILSASIRGRYQSVSELIAALNELIDISNPKHRYLKSTCPVSCNYFIGRRIELDKIDSAFTSGKRAVFICGTGGLGKTELALKYAQQYRTNYDVIAFGRYSDSLDELFKKTDFISVENNIDNETSIDTTNSLVDERTLLIIDNFDVNSDPKLNKVLSFNCKLLFTSRYSFEEIYENDSSVMHIKISELSLDEQAALFERECGIQLSKEDRNAMRSILHRIGGYTLLIPLIAKQYRKGDLNLSEIRQRIYDVGIKGASHIKVHHFKDTALSASLYGILCEVLNMAALSEDEIFVLRSLAFLGNTVIDRKEFNNWLYNQHQGTTNELIDKSWVQLQEAGPSAKLSLHKVICEMARSELKPDFQNCIWAYELCVKITDDLSPREDYLDLEYWEFPNECRLNSDHMASIVETIRRRKKAQLLISFLECLDYSKKSNITASIMFLSKIIMDIRFLDGNFSNDISIINDECLTDAFLSLLEMIISSPAFPEVAGDLRFETHRMINSVYLIKHLICKVNLIGDPYYVLQQMLSTINGIIDSLNHAEISLKNIPGLTDDEKAECTLHLALPIIMFMLLGLTGFMLFYTNSIEANKAVDTVFERAFTLLESVKPYVDVTLGFYDNNGNYSYSSFPFRDMFEARQIKYEALGYSYKHQAEDQNGDDDHTYEEWIEGNFDLNELGQEKADKFLEALLTDTCTSLDEKVERILCGISSLRFGPFHYGLNDDWINDCIDNKDKAKEYMNYLERLLGKGFIPNEDNEFGLYLAIAYYHQALLLACLDSVDKGDIEQLICKYYCLVKSDLKEATSFLDCFAYRVQSLFESLRQLGFCDVAALFIHEGISLLEAEIESPNENKERLYQLQCSLRQLADCAGNSDLYKRYLTASIDLLEEKLQNECETAEQQYEVLDLLIADVALSNDSDKTEYYKRKQQEIVGIGFDMQ